MLSIKEIEQQLSETKQSELELVLMQYANDERISVQKLLAKYRNKRQKLQDEYQRIQRMMLYEYEFQEQADHQLMICGIDEAGRGPLAGPVVAGAVILPEDISPFLYVNDSKQLSEKKREELYDVIMSKALYAQVGIVSAGRIDEINILQATYEAMRQAVSQLGIVPDLLLNDAVTIPGLPMRQKPIIKGDAKSLSIASASIIAKVTRDRMMRDYDKLYPQYGFAGHKGYGSAAHIAALKEYGPCPIHRETFIGHFV